MRSLFIPRSTIFLFIISFLIISCEEEVVLDLSENARQIKCIAHRGYVTDEIFENSIRSIDTAYDLGADGVEVDLIQTEDGTVILNHDPTINSNYVRSKEGKTCDFTTLVREQNGRDIIENCEHKDGTQILSLEDLLVRYHKKRNFTLLLDFKNVISVEAINKIKKYYADHPNDIIAEVSYGHDVSTIFAMKSRLSPIPIYVLNNEYVSGAELHYDGIETYKISQYHIDRLRASGVNIIIYKVKTLEEHLNAMSFNINAIDTDNIKACVEARRQLVEGI